MGFFNNKKRAQQQQVVPVATKTTDLALCPHCHKQLPKFPGRKGNCPFCQHTYLVRTDPESRKKVVVDAGGAKRIEKIYQQQAVENELERHLQSCTENYEGLYKTVEDDLTEKWMPKFGRGPSRRDVLWGVAGQLTLIYMKEQDFNMLGMVYFAQALFMHESGKDCLKLKQSSCDMELYNYAKMGGVKGVSVTVNSDCCGSCKKLASKTFSPQRRLKTARITK